MLTDGNVYHCQWTMAKIVAVYPGKDGIVRAVDVQIEQAVTPQGCKTKSQLARKMTTKNFYLQKASLQTLNAAGCRRGAWGKDESGRPQHLVGSTY